MKSPCQEQAELPSVLAACRHLVKSNGSIKGSEIAAQLSGLKGTKTSKPTKKTFKTLLECIPTAKEQGPCYIADVYGRLPIRHTAVSSFIKEFGQTLHSMGFGRGHRIALVLPNGPELALSILAVSQWAACVPLTATGSSSELAADLERCGADLVIGPYSAGPLPRSAGSTNDHHSPKDEAPRTSLSQTYGVMGEGDGSAATGRDWTVHRDIQELANEMNIPFVGLVPDPHQAGPFKLWVPPATEEHRPKTRSKLRTHQDLPVDYDALPIIVDRNLAKSGYSKIKDNKARFNPNTGHDEALVLFTSGTTGNKKLVPHQIGDILTAAVTIALSWELLPTDVNCNLMPLFHVGGIVRQVYSPLFSGGAVICCPSFDADLFWSLLKRRAFNWYYAAPTMHQIILQTGKSTVGERAIKTYKLKMIANAAGGLLPSLASEMRSTYGAAVLPSYGMTECMPISSPPASYDLSKPGTSGVPVGPEVAILNLQTMKLFEPMVEGPICVRGDPCFRGYGALANDPEAKRPESFLAGGWFNTGDLGYLDTDGYLYITGRSKEVINRGGEIISPMEVEEAIQKHPDVKMCAAFAAPHDILQEIVGIVLVTEPGRPRTLDLPALHSFIADKLATPKWPQCLIYMDGGLPKSHTNKLLRVKLGSRLGLPEFSDSMSPFERTFEAECPPQGAPLTDPIPSYPLMIDSSNIEKQLQRIVNSRSLYVVPHPQKPGAVVAHIGQNVDAIDLIKTASEKLNRYEVPSHICLLSSNSTNVNRKELAKIVPKPKEAVTSLLSGGAGGDSNADPLVTQIQDIFLELLGLDYIPAPDADFFQIGGSSMTASQLASKVRKSFGVACSGAEVFHHSTAKDLADMIRSRNGGSGSGETAQEDLAPNNKDRDFHQASFPTTRMLPRNTWWASLVQLVPIVFVFPIWQISRYLLFFATLLQKSRWFPDVTDRDFLSFLIAYAAFHLMWITIAPLVFVAIKWIVIGRYKEGRYPIWSTYYLRWWIVDVCRKLFLRGIYGSSDTTLRFYYRILGAKIGQGARISMDCELAEFDLVTIGKHAAVELSTVRGFGVDNGCMMLGPVKVGDASSVGLRSVVAPHTSVPDGEHLGPAISTYDATPGAMDTKHAHTNRKRIPEPSALSQIFLGLPLTFFVKTAAQIPPMMCTYGLLYYKSRENTENFFSNWNELMDWLCDPRRVPFFFGIRIARALLSPFFYMAFALLVKWTVIGKIEPGPLNHRSDLQLFKIWLSQQLFSRKKVQSVADLIGRHYGAVSCLYRLLGAKVGNRVFWPGNQPVCDGIYDLLEIGDDCVFGSRSSLLTVSVDRCAKIVMCAGSNVSDNCVVFPGTVVSKNAVLGSNSIAAEGMFLASGSVWFGSKGAKSECLEPGDADEYQQMAEPGQPTTSKGSTIASEMIDSSRLQMVGDETTIRPIGKAVYEGKSTYWFPPVSLLVVYAWISRIFCSVFHTLPLLGAVQFASVILYSDNITATLYEGVFGEDESTSVNGRLTDSKGDVYNEDKFWWFTRDFDNDGHHHTFGEVFRAVLSMYLITHIVRVILWLVIELSAKWAIMGRRVPGQYNYDTSNYALRWEIYQLTAKIRKLSRLNLLQFINGTPFLNSYVRMNGGQIGKDTCLYPAGADPFMPEPDLVTIGDRCVVDCASIVCHLNTRGNFQLAPIHIGDDCTLRTKSRVQQGVKMEPKSQLLEKSIAMTGECLDERTVWQGSP
eukprot:CAMPEP_0113509814 /NCGR_PEP_ID=MMETSP0014_2-20120614/37784_1 /TAXON_ID=2857 /ORGANISM="Nitzschia sp." /LENGTH=1713 /DNA_ID=CAMNT_0000405685 /DNA_START=253 /DNA_END=5390 /DNA_ORIENTATION=+ /assembly_acc=CAM_ASM_000159